MVENVNKNNNNETTDNLGRSLSNILTSIPLPDFQLKNIDVFQQDLESGYTPLHQVLNSGYIYKAFLLNESYKKKIKKQKNLVNGTQSTKNPWKIRDYDGLTPLELYMNKYFNDSKIKHYHKNEDTCKLYGFGKIINIELGLGNNNDSLKEIYLEDMIIDNIQMNNSRAIFIDSYQRLFVFKLKHIGEIIETKSFRSFIQEPHPGLAFLKCSISNTHTVAVTDKNKLVLFGDNEYGQCSMAPTAQTSTVMFISCSNVSSCLINSKNQLISWGLNTGQFGNTEISCNSHKKIHFNNTVSYLAKKCTIVDIPDSLGDIKQLIQLDYVTLILHGDNGLLVLSNFKKYHFFIPPLGTKEQSFNVKVSNRLTVGNKVLQIFAKDPYGNNILAKFENGILGHFISNTSDSSNIWRSQLFQLPFKIFYRPENNLLKSYHLDIADSKDNLKCGLLNFYGDYMYFSLNKSNQFQHKSYHKLLQNPDCLISDPDCNNFLIVKKEYDLKIEKVNNYKNLTENWLNLKVENNKTLISSLTMKSDALLNYEYKSSNNFDLEIVNFKGDNIARLHTFVLELLAPANVIFSSEWFEQITPNKIKYTSTDENDISALKDCIAYLYLGNVSNIDKVFKILNNTFKIKETLKLEDRVRSCLNEGSIEITTKSDSLYCEKDILMISSPVLCNLFKFDHQCSIVDLSNFEYSSVYFLTKYFHLFDIKMLLAVDGKKLTLVNLQELLCLSDYFLLSDLKNYIEYLISCKYINSKNFVELILVSINCNCQNLFKKMCEYLFLNIGVLFEDERLIQEIKDNFNFKVWELIEKEMKFLMKINLFDDSNCWYSKSDFRDTLKLFNTDLTKWNKIFNDRFVIENKKKYSTNNIRKSSICISMPPQQIERTSFSTSKKSVTPVTGPNHYSSVFDDEADDSNVCAELDLDENTFFKYKQGSYGGISHESLDERSGYNNSNEDFVLISKNKKKNGSNKSSNNPYKTEKQTQVPGASSKMIPGSQPLKQAGKRRTSSTTLINQAQKATSIRPLPNNIKPGPELTVHNQSRNVNSNMSNFQASNNENSDGAKMPALPTLSSVFAKEKSNTKRGNSKKSSVSSDFKIPTSKNISSNTSNILSIKDKANTKTVSNNMTLEDMISLAKKDTKKAGSGNSVWFQDKTIVSKTLVKSSPVVASSSGSFSNASGSSINNKWDYTKQKNPAQQIITLEEMMQNMRKK